MRAQNVAENNLEVRGAFGVRKSSFAFFTNLGNTRPKLIYPVASRSVWSAKVLFRFSHEPRKYETKAYISGGFAERLECKSPLSLLSRTSEIRDQSLYIRWLRGAFGVRKSSFAFVTNLGNTRPKLIYPVASRSVLEWSRKVAATGYVSFGFVFPRFVTKAKEDFRTPNAPRSHRICKLRFRISEVCEKAKEDFRTPNAPRISRLFLLRKAPASARGPERGVNPIP